MILAFLEPLLLLSGEKNYCFKEFFTVSVKMPKTRLLLKLNCFVLQSEKMKCLVLSRYPHSQPPINFPWLGAYFIEPI